MIRKTILYAIGAILLALAVYEPAAILPMPFMAPFMLGLVDTLSHCEVTSRGYYYTRIDPANCVRSEHNGRILKEDHKDKIKESMAAIGQLVPIVAALKEYTEDPLELPILNGWHRATGARELGLSSLDVKVYVGLTNDEQKFLAGNLDAAQKPLNTGEQQTLCRDIMTDVETRLISEGWQVINEERILSELAGSLTDAQKRRYVSANIMAKLLDEYNDVYISHAQTPKKVIVQGDKKTVFTAQIVENLFGKLCNTDPIGPWNPSLIDLDAAEYESQILDGTIDTTVDGLTMEQMAELRKAETQNVGMLFSIIIDEVIEPYLSMGQIDFAMAFARHHVIKAIVPIMTQILADAGSKRHSAPLFYETDEIDWEEVRKKVAKFRSIDWYDAIFTIRKPSRITDRLWREVFP